MSSLHFPALRSCGAILSCSLTFALAPVSTPAATKPAASSSASVNVAAIDRERILRAAAAALRLPPVTITASRARLSQGGPNDFYSNGDYWWPDPSKPDGLPYVQRDGESNPDNFSDHRRCVMQVRDAVAALAAAYRITGEERYSKKAVALLRVFFLEPSTRMNPHLEFAQAIPGRTPGRGIGIIDTLHLAEVSIAITVLRSSKAMDGPTLAGLKQWFAEYLQWMLASKNGQEEARAANNHSVAYWLQVAAFATLTGNQEALAEARRQYKEVFVPQQMASDGSFPAELKRTKPYGYSIFQLDNMATICQLLSIPGDNLWDFALSDGRGIRRAMEFLYPFLADKSRWPHRPDIQAWQHWPARQPCLLFAGIALAQDDYVRLWRSLSADPTDPEVRRNIAITQPLLWLAPAHERTRRPVTLESRSLRAEWDAVSGRLSLATKPGGLVFLPDAVLAGEGGQAAVSPVNHSTFGRGKALRVRHDAERSTTVMLFDSLPFALLQSSISNTGAEILTLKELKTLSARVELGSNPDSWKTFGTGGLLPVDKNPGSYAWMTVVNPASRNGVVLGWLTHDRGSGVLFSRARDGSALAEAEVEYGRLRIAPGKTELLETLALGFFEDSRLGLEAWADAVAKHYAIKLPPTPTGYCTWYSQPHGGASDETHLAELARFAATNLAPFGFSVVQIDDKWQDGVSTNGPRRNFTAHRLNGPYPAGMKAAADHLKSLGLVPGIWFMPFAGTYYDPFFANHQDWFVRRADGAPYETDWGGTCLDLTHPGARAHVRSVVERIGREWGYQYFKLDGLWTGTGTRQQYVNSGYKDDGMGDAVFHNPDKTNLEAYRDGLRLVRQAAGPGVFILGCNGPQNMRSYGGAFGLLDAMRIGPDNGSDWKSLLRGPVFGSRHYFLHGRIWLNDPDPVYVRPSMPLEHARLICSWVALSGQLNLGSEWLPGLPPERIEILRRTMPAHNLRPRPVDLFESDPPRLWLLSDATRAGRRDVVGLFNWEETDTTIECPVGRLGLDAEITYAAFDFWENSLLSPVRGVLRAEVPARSCRVIAVRPLTDQPQVISTSRHVTQGIVDLHQETWNARTRTLSGRSRVVAGDNYELRILARSAVRDAALSKPDRAAGAAFHLLNTAGGLLRLTITSPVTREIAWSVRFQ